MEGSRRRLGGLRMPSGMEISGVDDETKFKGGTGKRIGMSVFWGIESAFCPWITCHGEDAND